MYSYQSAVTRYLMSASEGKFSIRDSVRAVDFKTFADSVVVMDMFHYDPENVNSKWYGNMDSIYSSSFHNLDKIVNVLKEKDFGLFQRFLPEYESIVKKQIRITARKDVPEVFALWEDGRVNPNSTKDEYENTVKVLARNGITESGQVKATKTAILFMQDMREVVIRGGQLNPHKEVSMSMVDAVAQHWSTATNEDALNLAKDRATPEMHMFLGDIRGHPSPEAAAKYAISMAKNRILLQLSGAGGFIVSTMGRKFEVSSRGDGSSGLYYREYVIAENFTKSSESTVGVAVTTSAELSVLTGFSFSASLELSHSMSNGYAVSTAENPTSWKPVKEKSFLDGLGRGSESLGKLILFMNWYVGGLEDWYYVDRGQSFGCLMKEDPLPIDSLLKVPGIKIDTHFRMGDLAAAHTIRYGKDLSTTAFHTKGSMSANGVQHYTRGGYAYHKQITGFSEADADVCLNLSDDDKDILIG